MEIGLAPVAADAVAGASVAGSNVCFHADDGLETRFFGLFLELPRAVKVTVICYGESRLLEFERSTDEIVDPVGAVEEGVF